MLKKSASGVLASLRSSTYPSGYASALHSLRPCWTAILSILRCILSLAKSDRSLKQGSIAGVLLLIGVVSVGHALAHDPFASLKMNRLPAGSQAVPFELTALDGKIVKLSDLAGKVVLVNFWATWCGPCKEEMPSLARLQQQLDPKNFVLLTVTTDLQRQGIAQFLSQAGVTLPVLFDEDQEVSRSFMVRGLPTTVIIARDGSLAGRAVGPRAWDSPESVAAMQQMMESER